MAHALSSYLSLLAQLAGDGFRSFPICADFEGGAQPPFAYLRHDVDRFPARAVAMAEAEAALGVAGTYYFRCDRHTGFPRRAIERVQALGHEIGFHYECLSRSGGDARRAERLFERELAALRDVAPVYSVAPHGAPLSGSANMDLAAGIGFRRHDLLGDATAMDFSAILYITDTGGTFGSPHNLRDRPNGRLLIGATHPRRLAARLREEGESRILLSCHPERWPSGAFGLVQARLQDMAVNVVKRGVQSYRGT